MISWIPVLGIEGLVNKSLMYLGIIDEPVQWLLFSDFSVVVAYVHLFALFMIVALFNSMARIDPALIEAAEDAGASRWQVITQVVVPLTKQDCVVSIFVVALLWVISLLSKS
jgi:putative spermidine/putrescine transport system permease protein